MSLLLHNARLTNDPSGSIYDISIADGIVKSITFCSNDSSGSTDSTVERVDIKGNYVGERALETFIATCHAD